MSQMYDYDVAPPADEAAGIFAGEVLPDPFGAQVPDAAAPRAMAVPQLPGEAQLPPTTTFVPFDEPAVSLGAPGGVLGGAMGQVPAPQQHAVAQEGGHILGLSLLALASGSYLGYRYGDGMFGAISGVLAGGAAVNALRAALYLRGQTPEGRREALVSGCYALAGAVGAGILWYKTVHQARTGSSAGGSGGSSGARAELAGVRRAGP